jgi:hypothetical protein
MLLYSTAQLRGLLTAFLGQLAAHEWRKLHVITNEDKRISSHECTNYSGLANLSGLVHDHNIEVFSDQKR